jgi:hypothetical protein
MANAGQSKHQQIDKRENGSSLWHKATQVLLPALTIVGFLLTSLKKPQYGLIFNLISQIFWLYASWQAWKKANQVGILITTIFILAVVVFGVINYWVL